MDCEHKYKSVLVDGIVFRVIHRRWEKTVVYSVMALGCGVIPGIIHEVDLDTTTANDRVVPETVNMAAELDTNKKHSCLKQAACVQHFPSLCAMTLSVKKFFQKYTCRETNDTA